MKKILHLLLAGIVVLSTTPILSIHAAYDSSTGTCVVTDETDLRAALADSACTTVSITAPITATGFPGINIARAVTLEGNGNTLSVNITTATYGNHSDGLLISVPGVVVKDLTLKNESTLTDVNKGWGIQTLANVGAVTLDGVVTVDGFKKGGVYARGDITINGTLTTLNNVYGGLVDGEGIISAGSATLNLQDTNPYYVDAGMTATNTVLPTSFTDGKVLMTIGGVQIYMPSVIIQDGMGTVATGSQPNIPYFAEMTFGYGIANDLISQVEKIDVKIYDAQNVELIDFYSEGDQRNTLKSYATPGSNGYTSLSNGFYLKYVGTGGSEGLIDPTCASTSVYCYANGKRSVEGLPAKAILTVTINGQEYSVESTTLNEANGTFVDYLKVPPTAKPVIIQDGMGTVTTGSNASALCFSEMTFGYGIATDAFTTNAISKIDIKFYDAANNLLLNATATGAQINMLSSGPQADGYTSVSIGSYLSYVGNDGSNSLIDSTPGTYYSYVNGKRSLDAVPAKAVLTVIISGETYVVETTSLNETNGTFADYMSTCTRPIIDSEFKGTVTQVLPNYSHSGFKVTTTANGFENKLVKVLVELVAGNIANIDLKYNETWGSQGYLPLNIASGPVLYGPTTGFPLLDTSSLFAVQVKDFGVYTYKLSIVDATNTGIVLGSGVFTFELKKYVPTGGGGGGGGTITIRPTTGTDTILSGEVETDTGDVTDTPSKCSILGSSYSEEQNQAYLWACKNDITTKRTVQDAQIEDSLTRADLAKMMSTYAMTFMNAQPNTGKNCSAFSDSISQYSQEMKDYMVLSCQLDIMGINPDTTPLNDFMPGDYVTRAEFATVFSRVLWGNKYNHGVTWYADHLNALANEGIIKYPDPTITELRGWVLLMLYRSQQEK